MPRRARADLPKAGLVDKEVFKVENNSLELTRIFKESFKDQR